MKTYRLARLERENTVLKKQTTGMVKHIDELEHDMSEIKYLNRKEVNRIMVQMVNNYNKDCGSELNNKQWQYRKRQKAITAICSLALPITKEKIIKVLERKLHYREKMERKKFRDNDGKIFAISKPYKVTRFKMIQKEDIEQIASEILGDDGE